MSVLILGSREVDVTELSVRSSLGMPLTDSSISIRAPGPLTLGTPLDISDILGRPIVRATIYEVSGQDASAETLIARLRRTPAVAWMDYPSDPNGFIYADEALNSILWWWQHRVYPWFTARTLPMMFIRRGDGTLYRPKTKGVVIMPDEDGRLPTMAEVIEEWLGSFPGYSAVVQGDTLVIVPPRDMPITIGRRYVPLSENSSTHIDFTVLADIPLDDTRRLYVSGAIAAYRDGVRVARIPFSFNIDEQYTLPISVSGDQQLSGYIDFQRYSALGELWASVHLDRYPLADISLYFQVYYSPIQVLGNIISIRTSMDISQLANRAVVENTERYDYVRTDQVLIPSVLRIWGAYTDVGCRPGATMRAPSLSDLSSGRNDLGLIKLRNHTTTSPYLPPQTVFVPASGTYVVGEWVEVYLRFRWWADQHCDSPGPSPAGDVTLSARVRLGDVGTVRSWPSLPGPNACPPEGAFAEVQIMPTARNGILEGVYLTIWGAFTNARWSLCGGDWAVGLGLEIDGSAPILRRSNERVIGIYGENDPMATSSQALWGVLEKRHVVRAMMLSPQVAQDIARAIVKRGLSPTAIYEVELAAPYLPAEHLGYPVQIGQIRGRLVGWEYHEAHAPDKLSVRCTIRLADTATIQGSAPSAIGYYVQGAYTEAAY